MPPRGSAVKKLSNYNFERPHLPCTFWYYSAFLFTSVFLVYIAFLSKLYNFDGIACAGAVELGDPRFLLHGNHLAYGYRDTHELQKFGLFYKIGAIHIMSDSFSLLEIVVTDEK